MILRSLDPRQRVGVVVEDFDACDRVQMLLHVRDKLARLDVPHAHAALHAARHEKALIVRHRQCRHPPFVHIRQLPEQLASLPVEATHLAVCPPGHEALERKVDAGWHAAVSE